MFKKLIHSFENITQTPFCVQVYTTLFQVLLKKKLHDLSIEWVSECCFMPKEQFFAAISCLEQVLIMRWWCQILIRPTRSVSFCSASSLKQHSTSRHVAPVGHIILNPSQPVFYLYSLILCALQESSEYQFYSFKIRNWTQDITRGEHALTSLRANPLARSAEQVKLDSDKWKL